MAYPEKVTYNTKYNLKPIVEPDGQMSAENANELKEKINRNALFHGVESSLSALQAKHPNPPVGAFAYLIDGSHYRCVNIGWTTNEGSGSGSSYFKGYYLSLAALKTAHPVATPGDRAIIKVTGANDKEALWDEDDQEWFAFEFVSGGTSAPEDQTKLLSFVSGWDSGFTYYPFARFRIDGIESTDTRERILSAADPDLPRKDQFAIDIATKQIVILEGVPGENPADPNINLETHLPGPIVDIPAGATEPVGASKKLIFDEGVGAPDEWPVTSITFAVTETSPITGTKSLEGTNLPKGAFVRFDPANPVLLSEFTQLQLKIKNKVASSGDLVVYFHGTRPNGKLVSYREIGFLKNFGYDPNNITDVQKIVLPVSASDVQSLRSLYIQNNNETSEAFGCLIDEVLQGATGEENVVPGDYATREELAALERRVTVLEESFTNIEENEFSTHPAF